MDELHSYKCILIEMRAARVYRDESSCIGMRAATVYRDESSCIGMRAAV